MEFSVNPGTLPNSEDEILTCLARYFTDTQPPILLGRGDDCAVMQFERPITVSSDLFLEKIHFRTEYFTPEEIGHKALAVNLRDIAACGAKPVAFTLNLGLPTNTSLNWLESFFFGMSSLANKYKTCLIGGDLSRAESLQIGITIFGEVPGASRFLARGGSMPGDLLFLIGQIGLAQVGLNVLEQNGREACEKWPRATKAHLAPTPYINAGQVLSRAAYNARPPALMDISDGLMRDLPRLLGLSGELGTGPNEAAMLGARFELNLDDLHPELLVWSHEQHLNPITTALVGGEDYALLGTCAPDLLPTLKAAIPEFLAIGEITDEGKIVCNEEELGPGGFDHFA
ncbi:MAG: thiamine-phosphate kinase [Desulfovibrionaceae bacterium]|nr:thiamine-phosphate kinase [Desulfovibrionaceae bacterium]